MVAPAGGELAEDPAYFAEPEAPRGGVARELHQSAGPVRHQDVEPIDSRCLEPEPARNRATFHKNIVVYRQYKYAHTTFNPAITERVSLLYAR